MSRLFRYFCPLLAGIMWFSLANAATIVDTGPGPSYGGGWTLGQHQWLAVQFTIDTPWQITDIYGWIGTERAAGEAHVSVYQDDGGLPGDRLFSVKFLAIGAGYNWRGASGLDWPLEAGTYWASFEVQADDSFLGAMSHPSIVPVEREASWQHLISGYEGWFEANGLDIGVQIHGIQKQVLPATVPEPGTLLLNTTGVLGLLTIRSLRRKRERAEDQSPR